MGIRNNTLKMMLNISFLLLSYMSFSQNENIMSKEMIRYSVKCELKLELDKILNKLKPVDQKLIFTVNMYVKNDTCQISLTTSYDVQIENNWVGFCEYRGKLFLLESIMAEEFFAKVGQDVIQVDIKKTKKSNDIVQPHLDNLPYWLLEYNNGKFTTKLSSY
jgi:hypothetical protein